MKVNTSPYSKMYLVTPKTYEQVLSCLDEKEKKVAEELNFDKDIIEEERPGEKYIEKINQEELLNPAESEIMEQGQNIQPQIVNLPSLEPQTEEESTEIPLAELQRQKKNDLLRAGITFKKKKFVCPVCLKEFDRNWSLNRHIETVHRNLQEGVLEENSETNIPATLNIQRQSINPTFVSDDDTPMIEDIQRVTPKFISDDDVPMMTDVKKCKNPLKQACRISADTSDRIIPDTALYFKPPRKGRIVIPSIKKRMMLIPKISKIKLAKTGHQRNVKFNIPANKGNSNLFQVKKPEEDDLIDFEDWTEPKKRLARTSNEAKFPSAPIKKYKAVEDTEKFTDWA